MRKNKCGDKVKKEWTGDQEQNPGRYLKKPREGKSIPDP